MPKTYTLKMSECQAEAVLNGLELLSRLHMAQFSALVDYFCIHNHKAYDRRVDRDMLDRVMRAVHKEVTGLDGSHYAISSPDVSVEGKRAFDMMQVLRQRIAYDRQPSGGHTVNFDDPISYTGEPLMTVTSEEVTSKPS